MKPGVHVACALFEDGDSAVQHGGGQSCIREVDMNLPQAIESCQQTPGVCGYAQQSVLLLLLTLLVSMQSNCWCGAGECPSW